MKEMKWLPVDMLRHLTLFYEDECVKITRVVPEAARTG
jgi:hypothetical protein